MNKLKHDQPAVLKPNKSPLKKQAKTTDLNENRVLKTKSDNQKVTRETRDAAEEFESKSKSALKTNITSNLTQNDSAQVAKVYQFATSSVAYEELQETLARTSESQIALKVELEDRQEEIKTLRELSSSLHGQLASLRAEMNEQLKKEEILRLKMERNDHLAHQQQAKLHHEIEEYKKVICDKESLITELDDLVSTLRDEIESLNLAPKAYADSWIYDVRLEKLENEIAEKDIYISNLKQENDTLKYTEEKNNNIIIGRLSNENKSLKTDLEINCAEIFRMKELLSAKEQQFKEYREIKQESTISIQEHKSKVLEMQIKLESSNAQCDSLQKVKANLESKVDQCNAIITELNSEKNKNITNVENLETELLALQTQIFGYNRDFAPKLARLEAELAHLRTENESLKSEKEEFNEKFGSLQEEVKTCYEIIEIYQEKENELEKIESEHAELIEMYQSCELQISKLQETIEKLNEQHKNDSLAYETIEHALENCLKENEMLNKNIVDFVKSDEDFREKLLIASKNFKASQFKLATKDQQVIFTLN